MVDCVHVHWSTDADGRMKGHREAPKASEGQQSSTPDAQPAHPRQAAAKQWRVNSEFLPLVSISCDKSRF